MLSKFQEPPGDELDDDDVVLPTALSEHFDIPPVSALDSPGAKLSQSDFGFSSSSEDFQNTLKTPLKTQTVSTPYVTPKFPRSLSSTPSYQSQGTGRVTDFSTPSYQSQGTGRETNNRASSLSFARSNFDSSSEEEDRPPVIYDLNGE
eukprot:TRINITY_DN112_c0_g1_i3.p1 TRINITY_DN112_c0_g1~~TRINITY_DN112_c0_g1_i3.p1  ORF type:complete len:148 (+),score=29.26 TRINITY_DN112_c0_g1_i3:539-982(+)